jgi:hypothetical protein
MRVSATLGSSANAGVADKAAMPSVVNIKKNFDFMMFSPLLQNCKLYGFLISFSGSDPANRFNGNDKDLAVTYFAGFHRPDDGVNNLLNLLVVGYDLDFCSSVKFESFNNVNFFLFLNFYDM